VFARKVVGVLAIAVAATVSNLTPSFGDTSNPPPDNRSGNNNVIVTNPKGTNGKPVVGPTRVDLAAIAGAPPGDLPSGSGVCFSSTAVESKAEETVEYEEVITVDVNKKTIRKSVPLRTFEVKTYSCNGKVLGVSRKCVSGKCPPAKKKKRPSIWSVVRYAVATDELMLDPPELILTPRPSSDAPLVGLPMFYGTTQAQWNLATIRYLSACSGGTDDYECQFLSVKINADTTLFDPGASLDDRSIRETCKRPTPDVHSFEDATNAGRDCAVVFQNAGTFEVRFGLRYHLDVVVITFSEEDGANSRQADIYATAWQSMSLTTRQRQPVLKR
jgi:hypothetical protein